MDKTFLQKLYHQHQVCPTCPSPAEVAHIFQQLLGILFPDFSTEAFHDMETLQAHINRLQQDFEKMIGNTAGNGRLKASDVALRFFEAIPKIHQRLEHDITAMYEGDPAAKSTSEVVRTYPGFYAIAAYRLAHELHRLGKSATRAVLRTRLRDAP